MCPATKENGLITINVYPSKKTTMTPLKKWRPLMSVRRTTTRAHDNPDATSWLRNSQGPRIWSKIMMRNILVMRVMTYNLIQIPIQRPMKSASITVASFNSSASTHQTWRRKRTSLNKLMKVRRMTMTKRSMKRNRKNWLTTL